jgi:signal peptidase II
MKRLVQNRELLMLDRAWPFLISLLVIALDRATKHWIETQFRAWDVVSVIPGLFQIVHTRNSGIAFGMFGGNGRTGQWLLIGFSLAVMALVVSLIWSASSPAPGNTGRCGPRLDACWAAP